MNLDTKDWWTRPEEFRDWILTGQDASQHLENDLDDFLSGEDGTAVQKMFFDTYDGSIELCLAADLKFEPESLRAKLAEYGFTYGWLNFSDGTEQHFGQGKIYERKKATNPRWSEKDAKEAGF